jgi:prepilin-type processing-associated H-X9-DG protein
VRVIAAAAVAAVLLLPASAEAGCRRYSNRADLGALFFHTRLFSTTVSTRWCFDGRRVTRLGRVRIYPALSTLGTLVSWEFKGVTERENRLLRVGGRRHAGYRVRRVLDWRRCITNCHHVYLEMNNYLYADGHARRFNRVRKP